MSGYYVAYFGNKRTELKHLDLSNIHNYDYIVEPFAGSCAFSFHCFHKLNYRGKIIINDIDTEHIEFLRDCKENGSKQFFDYCNEKTKDITKEKFYEIARKKNPDKFEKFFRKKCYSFRHGVYDEIRCSKSHDHTKYIPYDNFLQHAEIYNEDYETIYDKYKNENALFFLDPPYLNSFNTEYETFTNKDGDGTYFYVDIYKKLKQATADIIMIINGNSMTRHLYRKYIIKEYVKNYTMSKRTAKHIVVSNITPT